MSKTSSQEQRTRLEQMEVTNPDALLNARKPTSTPVSIGVAVVLHIVVLGVTSTALFVDWSHYGLHLPSTIRTIKEEQAATEQAKLDAEKAAEESAKAKQQAEEDAAKQAETRKPEDDTSAKPEAVNPAQDIGDEDPFADL